MSALARLEKLWKADDHGLPFCSSVNEAHVFTLLTEICSDDLLDDNLRQRVQQWIIFNRSANIFEGDPYLTWVEEIYSKISVLISVEDMATGE